MLYKLYTHIAIKHYVRHMSTKQITIFLMSYENLKRISSNHANISFETAINLMSIFRPYILKERKRRK